MLPALYKHLVHGNVRGAFGEALERSSRELSKLRKEGAKLDRSRDALEDSGLCYLELRYLDSIRILELLPAVSTDSPLEGRLRLSRIEDHTRDFEALSYVWGDVSETVDLHCEGRVMGITRNLDSALRHARYSDRPRYLWVDAICINQSDIRERGHQVRLMRSIYKTARQVLVWIAEDQPYHLAALQKSDSAPGVENTTKAKHAFAILNHVYDKSNQQWAAVIKKELATQDGAGGERNISIERIRGTQSVFFDSTWEVVEDFFSSPWFGRQWIIQEVVVATSVTVLWGHQEIAWTKIGETANWLKKNYPQSRRHLIAGAFNASYIFNLAMEARYAKRLHRMSTVVASAWNCQATDPRDKIYAMLGLPNLDSDPDRGDLFLKPDYSCSKQQVYKAFARKVIEKEQTLRLFSTVQHDAEASIPTPSWVPQWEPPCAETLVPFGIMVNHMPPLSLFEDPLHAWDEEALFVRGITLSTVAGTSQTRLPRKVDVDDESDWSAVIWRVEQILNAQSRELTLGQLKSLCWTLTVGRGNDLWGNHINHWDTFQTLWLEARRNLTAKSWHLIGRQSQEELNEPRGLNEYLGSATYGRRIFVAEDGTIGLGPAVFEPGDIVVLLFGGFTPYILRRIDDHYILVGECYVHGQMNGAAIEEWHERGEEAESFVLR